MLSEAKMTEPLHPSPQAGSVSREGARLGLAGARGANPGARELLREVVTGLELLLIGLALLTATCGGMIYRLFEFNILMLTPAGWLLVLLGLWGVRALILSPTRQALRRQMKALAGVFVVAILVHVADGAYLDLRSRKPDADWAGPLPRREFPVPKQQLSYPGANVILLSIDTLRADHLGCYGYREDTSPHIDAFAQEAVRFARTYAASNTTLPSHATMMTSLYPGTHKAEVGRFAPVPEEVTTLAEVLAAAGYHTVAIVDDGELDAIWGLNQGFETYAVSLQEGMRTVLPLAFERLEALRKEKFFLFLHTYDVHTPYRPTPHDLDSFFAHYQGAFAPPIDDNLSRAVSGQYVRADLNDIRFMEAAYDACIRWTDVQVGLLLTRLHELGLDKNTIVIITADHGEGFNEHGKVATHRYDLYDELLRVPLVVRFPDGALAGSVLDYNVSLVDLMPSLLPLLMLPYDGPMQGKSILPLLEGKEPREDRVVFAESACDADPFRSQRSYAVGRYKFIQKYLTWRERLSAWVGRTRAFYTLAGRRLFDTYHDYDETRNLLALGYRETSALPIAQWLEDRMLGVVRDGRGLAIPVPQPVTLTPEELERMRGLGYIQPARPKEAKGTR
jgi:arylsulfatase A-like enzyme